MKPHGDTTVTVEGIVVRSKPRYSSNPEGIKNNWEQILKGASGLDRWILWADTDESFALTPEALEKVESFAASLKEHRCIALIFTVSNPIMPFYISKIKAVIGIPFFSSESGEEIKDFITQISTKN
ncbi:MAG: hypothetical protein J7L76_02625 [Spirochaetaceae bacterium]|nr:hypothetical protein [Spirochaetaceae bacterium]RKX76327.1 MAG: hypothetical protein DRP60_07705 [Spirochaetota bacterium]